MILSGTLRKSTLILFFLFSFFPLGGGGLIKPLFLALTLFLYFLNVKWLKVNKASVIIYLSLLIIFLFSYIHFLYSPLYYAASMTILNSIFVSIVIYCIATSLIISGILSVDDLLRYIIYGLVSYVILKTVIVILIYCNIVDITIINNISPDMTSLGNIGANGLIRIVGVNDFLLPFFYFFIDKTSIKNKRITKAIILFAIFFSFTRSIWLGFIILIILHEIIINKKINKILSIAIILFFTIAGFSIYTDFDLLFSIQQRLFIEGSGSSNEKFRQAILMINKLSEQPIFGYGLGSYIPEYIRNDRLKYGYEVANLSLVMQLGIIASAILISIMLISLFLAFRKSKKSKFDVFLIISLVAFILFGFSNPVVMSSVSVVLYLAIMRTLDSHRSSIQ
ncbi:MULTISPECIES: O-antigen ligase family protein [unclassified Providencia]|uniref:O-antigen ligase family protein n=1 Tax=unclassified Providencia TaxID=2633465 RepID=UPI00229F7304|nr:MULTISPECIES: O-antigen ligase family protein [unclassified Providencia]HCT9038696.1 hypothetical protein [Providencia rettgeri]